MISSEPDLRFPCRRSYERDGNKITQTRGVLPQTGLKWAEMVLNKSCLSLVQKYLKRCSRDQAALLLPVPLNRKERQHVPEGHQAQVLRLRGGAGLQRRPG
ncbi:cell division cycle-associated protein 4-like isoform X1, partial [Lates japonicus]